MPFPLKYGIAKNNSHPLQTTPFIFPPGFFFQGSLRQQWRQIGNAVPPLLAKALGEAILYFEQRQEQLQIEQHISDLKTIRSTAFDYKLGSSATQGSR